MAVRKYKPTTPGRRGASVSSFEGITRDKPERSLVAKGRNRAGRNSQGRITTRHQGGGNKRRYRVIDFKREKDGVPAKVAHIEYDPNRTARIALLHYADGRSATSWRPTACAWATGCSRARAPTSVPATRSRCGTSRSAPRCTRSS